jgi:hypothetical protein
LVDPQLLQRRLTRLLVELYVIGSKRIEISRLRFRWGMDAVIIGNLVTISLLLCLIAYLYLKNDNLDGDREELFERLEVLDRGMNMIGTFLEKIPEMQPQFSINQSPLSQFLEFITNMKAEAANANQNPNLILADDPIRDDQGRYSDGAGQQEQQETQL